MKKIIVICFLVLTIIILLYSSHALAEAKTIYPDLSLLSNERRFNEYPGLLTSPSRPDWDYTDLSVDFVRVYDPSINPGTVYLGGVVTYTIEVYNSSLFFATNVIITDTLTAGLSFVSVSPECSESGSIVTCHLYSLGAFDSYYFTIVAIAPAAPGPLVNSAVVTSRQTDLNPADNYDTFITKVCSLADIQIGISDTPDPVLVNGIVTYTLTITNNGPEFTIGSVTNWIPWLSTLDHTSPGCGFDGQYVVTCDFGNLNPGESTQLIIVVIAPSQAAEIGDHAQTDGYYFDSNYDNNLYTELTIVGSAVADVQITSMIDAPDPVPMGRYLTYYINVYNAGPGDAESITMQDPIPEGTELFDAPMCGYNNRIVYCGYYILPAYDSVTYTITVIAPSVVGIITNTASVSGWYVDPDNSNDTVTEDTTVGYHKIYITLISR
jgi:uncharacterized repeat protein (TIGR01451 family)